jgi:hypothetical protein
VFFKSFGQTELLLRSFSAILGAAITPVGNPGGIQAAAHGVISHTRQILDTAAPDQDHRVLLQVVTFATDVTGDLKATPM